VIGEVNRYLHFSRHFTIVLKLGLTRQVDPKPNQAGLKKKQGRENLVDSVIWLTRQDPIKNPVATH
jgi:hypothetical protein